MQLTQKFWVLGIRRFSFKDDNGKPVTGSKVIVGNRAENDPNKKGVEIEEYSAPITLYDLFPGDLPKELNLKVNVKTGKYPKIDVVGMA